MTARRRGQGEGAGDPSTNGGRPIYHLHPFLLAGVERAAAPRKSAGRSRRCGSARAARGRYAGYNGVETRSP
jgi:hypothetical protein